MRSPRYGYGVASVRFICGTQSVHRELEERLSAYLGMEDTILYSSCFDANGGLFETLLDERDAVISDALNHASIIDGIRLCKARRLRYANNDMNELEQALKDSQDARMRLIATDGVFSMDGSIAKLEEICDLAERHAALVMVDDSHATGFIGARGRGTHELRGVMERVDIITSTLGKALGGASGGYVSARREIVGWLRQRSRPYLFSNSIAPPVAAGTLKVLDLLEATPELRDRLHANARYFPRAHAAPRLRPAARRASDRAHHAGRSAGRRAARRAHAGGRRLRGRVLLSGGTARQGADPHPVERRAFDRAARSRGSGVCARGRKPRHHQEGKLMKALVKARAEPGIWMQDVPEPAVGHNDVLIKIHRSAICGTDMHIYNWDAWAQKTIPVPMAVGHEYSGEIVEVGSEVRGVKAGDRVSGEGHITCGHCRNCRAGRRHLCRNTLGVGVNRPGAFAEYLTLPAANVFKLSPAIDDEVASILDPFGNATHTALAFNVVGEDVLITGAGPIGIMAVAIARYCGARHIVITDVNQFRLDLAAQMGASKAINVTHESLDDAMRELGMEEGFDVGFEMSGNAAALREMLRTMHHGGSISMLGIPPGETAIDWNQVIFKGLVIKGIYGREMFETWYKMSSMLQSGLNVRPVITHRLGVNDYREGFEIMNSGKSGKVILDWSAL